MIFSLVRREKLEWESRLEPDCNIPREVGIAAQIQLEGWGPTAQLYVVQRDPEYVGAGRGLEKIGPMFLVGNSSPEGCGEIGTIWVGDTHRHRYVAYNAEHCRDRFALV